MPRPNMLEATRSASRTRRRDVTAENSAACGVRDERRPGSDAVRSIYCGLREGGRVWVFMVRSKRGKAGIDKKGCASRFRVAKRLHLEPREISAFLVILPSPACSQSQRIRAAVGAKPCSKIAARAGKHNGWKAHLALAPFFLEGCLAGRFRPSKNKA